MDLQQIKTIIGGVTVSLVFVGYIPYLRDIIKGKTIPHLYSWFLWGFATTIAFALQLSGGAGIAAFITLGAALMCGVVILLSLIKHKGKRDITMLDTFFLIMALISLFIWIFAKQPVISAILVTTTDLLGFLPTIRKSWYKPFTETLSLNILNTIRFALATFALQHYSIITTLYPVSWFIANGLFSAMLIIRRKQVEEKR